MKKKLISVIIIITTLSLLGIVFTQLYWVKKAVELRQEQFSSGIQVALKTVVSQLLARHNDSTIKRMQEEGADCVIEKTDIRDLINASYLDSLMQQEMGCLKIFQDYEYAVINFMSNKIVMGAYDDNKDELFHCENRVSLSSLYEPGDYWLVVYVPNQTGMIIDQMIVWLILSALFLVIVIFTFAYTIHLFIRQKKLSEMKTDFVNNMTHEFKTPISTISLASEMLLNPAVTESVSKTRKYARVIFDENVRLQNQVERVLQIAILDKGDAKLKLREVDVHKIVSRTVSNFTLMIKKREGKVLYYPGADRTTIVADKMHLINIVANLIDNASKYSPGKPQITVRTWNHNNGIKVSVEDKGIGIARENQKHIFKKLYRVPTGNLHDTKGFGLGLYYVKTIIEAHGGYIDLHSEPGNGSRFEFYLPFDNKHYKVHEEEE